MGSAPFCGAVAPGQHRGELGRHRRLFVALIPIGILGQLVNIGTLLAFIIVCSGVWILRKPRPDLPRPFKTPLVPFVPIMGILIFFLMMTYLLAWSLLAGLWFEP